MKKLKIPQQILLPCGLSCSTKTLKFAQGRGMASSFSEGGNHTVQIVCIDEVLKGIDINFIKLDIEGSELDALKGMEKTIKSNKQIAIAACIYHKPEHFWEVPLFLRKILPTHTFYLRSHGYCGFDLVVYALPRK